MNEIVAAVSLHHRASRESVVPHFAEHEQIRYGYKPAWNVLMSEFACTHHLVAWRASRRELPLGRSRFRVRKVRGGAARELWELPGVEADTRWASADGELYKLRRSDHWELRGVDPADGVLDVGYHHDCGHSAIPRGAKFATEVRGENYFLQDGVEIDYGGLGGIFDLSTFVRHYVGRESASC